MAELFLKNSTGSEVVIDDQGIVIADGQSITIDENDFDGYLTADMIAALSDDPLTGLVLSTTDIGDTSGDLPAQIAQERITMKSHWKPMRDSYANLPIVGNEDGDLRLVTDTGIIYRWDALGAEWSQTTSTFSLQVTEYDEDPLGTEIEKLVFVQPEDNVYIDTNDIKRTAYIGPPGAPLSLSGQPLSLYGTNLVNGGLSQSNTNYKSTDPAGDVVSYITRDVIFNVETPSGDYSNYGDRGLVKVYINNNLISTIDLGANFDTSLRDNNQDLTTYDTQGLGDPITDGVAAFTGSGSGYGQTRLLSVGKYNNFKFYQTWRVRVEFTDASIFRQGYNEIQIVHELDSEDGGNQQSAVLDIFYDTDSGPDPTVSTPIVADDVPVFQWLSGVKYYDQGSTWTVDVTGNNLFNNVYHSSGAPIVLSGWPGLSATNVVVTDASVTGVSDPPDIGEIMTISSWGLTQAPNQASSNAIITATPRDPYGSYTAAQSASDNYLIWSYGTASTELVEHFRDEQYRLLDQSYDTIPVSIIGEWDSEQSLVTYDGSNGLQLYMDELIFPVTDFSTYKPTGNPDYSGLAIDTDKVYVRAFRHVNTSHASGTLRLTGITKSQLYNRDVKVWIKAPSQTGWLDLTRDYNFSDFSGVDGDGCWVDRDVQSNSDFKFTLGTNYTQNSGWMIIVKVQYPSVSAPTISYMSIIDW